MGCHEHYLSVTITAVFTTCSELVSLYMARAPIASDAVQTYVIQSYILMFPSPLKATCVGESTMRAERGGAILEPLMPFFERKNR